MYETIDDLPFVCRINLPEEAQHVWRDAFNGAWGEAASSGKSRHRTAQQVAWNAVRERFERDGLTGRWVPRATPLQARERRSRAAG